MIIITFQYIHHVAQDTLVQTVGENVPILITVRNVKVNVTVIWTYVTYLPDVSLLQQVTTDDVKLFICLSFNICRQLFTTLKLIVFTVQAGCIPGYVGENCRGKCTYPYYGMDCQNQCDCDESRCDFSTGCTNFTKGIASPFTPMVINNKLYFQTIITSFYL